MNYMGENNNDFSTRNKTLNDRLTSDVFPYRFHNDYK